MAENETDIQTEAPPTDDTASRAEAEDQAVATDVAEPAPAEKADQAATDGAADASPPEGESDAPEADAREGDAGDDASALADELLNGMAESADEASENADMGSPSEAVDATADLASQLLAEFDSDQATSALPGGAGAESGLSDDLRRIVRIQAPVIVKLAEKKLTLGEIVDLSPGSIVEFARNADQPLELLINNKVIGHGTAVKVGEKFGLRIDEIKSVEDTIRSLGG